MAISKRKNTAGKVVGYTVVAVVPNPQGGRGSRHVVGTYRTRKLAEDAERRAKDQVQAGTFCPAPAAPSRVWTVADVVKGWLIGRKAMVSTNTHGTYESAYRLHLADAVGGSDIATLTRADVKELVRGWQDAGMGEQLQNRSLLVLRCALDEAVEDGILAANPATGIKLPSPKKRTDIPHWTPSELHRFLDACERDQLGAFWFLAAVEGCRRAEGLGVRWSDVTWGKDETTATMTVTQTVIPNMTAGGAPLVQARAKTKGSQRTIALTTATVEALKRQRDRQTFQRQAAGEAWANLDLIVCDELGGPIRPDSVDRHRDAVIAEAGVPPLTTHQLRHGAAARMLKAGVPIAVVAEKLGHQDVSLTYSTYGHLSHEDQTAANDAITAFLARAGTTG